MSYVVNWNTKVITIPKADTEFISSSPDVRSLDINDLWAALRDIEDDEDGINFSGIIRNTPPLTVAGLTLGRVLEIINGYTLTFEDGFYAVNISGGNSNVADVVNKNSVAVNTSNSAGFIQVAGEGSVPVDFDDLLDGEEIEAGITVRQALRAILAVLPTGKASGSGSGVEIFRSADDSKDRVIVTVDDNGNRTNVELDLD